MKNKEFFSTIEISKILGISRVAVFKKIKRGEINAQKVGRNYVIAKNELDIILGKKLSKGDKKNIDKAIHKTISEYGETLKLLGKD